MLSENMSVEGERPDYRHVFAAMPAPAALVALIDGAPRILAATAGFAQVLGLPVEGLAGARLDEVLRLRAVDRLMRAAARAASVRTHLAYRIGGRIVRFGVEARAMQGALLLLAFSPAWRGGVRGGGVGDRALDIAQAEQNERRRVGRELHDSTSQHLVAAQLGLAALERRAAFKGEAGRIAAEVRRSIGAAQGEIRTFSFMLHPPGLAEGGLPRALEAFGAGFAARTGLKVVVEAGEGPWSLSRKTELALFRVAQEALMNVYRHARGRRATVRLFRDGSAIVLEVEDDGVGLRRRRAGQGSAEPLGVGMSSMLARMTQVGGSLALTSRRKGLKVSAWAPLPSSDRVATGGRV